MPEAPPEVLVLAEQRAAVRAAGDFAAADDLRERIAAAGWTVKDVTDGWALEPAIPAIASGPMRAQDVATMLGSPVLTDVSVQWVLEGWPEDVERAIVSFRAHQGELDVQYVVTDVTGVDPDRFGPDVEVVSLEKGTGWGAARNAGLRRSTGELVFVMDGSIEVTGDVFSPLASVLGDPGIGLAGPFGIVTRDLREFDEAPGTGPCDAVEGYFMGMQRELLTRAGLFDEKFTWYRTADIEFSFRVKDLGMETVVVDLPVIKHPHRMWFETDPSTRAKWSKRNYYRFLDRWRDRWDLVLHPQPPGSHLQDDGH